MSSLRSTIDSYLGEAVAIRHDLHSFPELCYEEVRTSQKVQETLGRYGVQYKNGLAGGTGVLGYLPATKPGGKCIALRADMDALPILEDTGLAYSSTCPGVMHACGHDGHTTILLTAARVLAQQTERPNDVLFVFQPAEEKGAGALRMCEDGVLDGSVLGRQVDSMFGLHGFSNITVGNVSTRVGPLMAATAQFAITITGKGSHAAYPHYGIDPIVVAAHLITALQTVASRTVSPLESVVVTVGQVVAGVAHNVIPDTAVLQGTLRTLTDETSSLARGAIENLVRTIPAAFGASGEIEWVGGYPTTVNDEQATEHFRAIARKVVGPEHTLVEENPTMGGEDFSYYGRRVPACFFFLGLRPEGQTSYPNLHSPQFDFNDACIPYGVELMCELALS